MKHPAHALCTLLLLYGLAGCGSGSSPPMAVSCTTHHLPGGRLLARVTVTNTTGATSRAILYGPALAQLRHIKPVLPATQVVVHVGKERRSYFGYVIRRFASKKVFHLMLRFAPLHRSTSLVAAQTRTVTASNWDVIQNGDCLVGG